MTESRSTGPNASIHVGGSPIGALLAVCPWSHVPWYFQLLLRHGEALGAKEVTGTTIAETCISPHYHALGLSCTLHFGPNDLTPSCPCPCCGHPCAGPRAWQSSLQVYNQRWTVGKHRVKPPKEVSGRSAHSTVCAHGLRVPWYLKVLFHHGERRHGLLAFEFVVEADRANPHK